MHPSLGIGFELGPPASRDDLSRVVRAVGAAGVDVLWFDGPAAVDGTARAEAVTLAAGASVADGRIGLGVRVALADGRHPAVVARELTALDLISGGRAVLALRTGRPAADAPGPAGLNEAVTICHGLFDGGPVVLAGSRYSVTAAVNRPGPRQAGGPPMVVELDDGQPAGPLAPCLGLVAGWMTGGDEETVADRRRELDDLADGPVTLLWRGELGDSAARALAGARRLIEAGADGVVVVPTGPAGPSGPERDLAAVVRGLRPSPTEPASDPIPGPGR